MGKYWMPRKGISHWLIHKIITKIKFPSKENIDFVYVWYLPAVVYEGLFMPELFTDITVLLNEACYIRFYPDVGLTWFST